MPRAKLRTPALRAHVLEVALGILESDGVAGFTARRIAAEARTSMPAVYELFGDKPGLVRELFFEGFRMLRRRFDGLAASRDPRADLVAVLGAFRAFVRRFPVLAAIMFSQPFADFDPGPAELRAGAAVREFIVGRVRRAIDAGRLAGDATDVAHVLLAVAQGLVAQERAGWLGSSKASIDRRWRLGIRAALDGLAVRDGSPAAPRPSVPPAAPPRATRRTRPAARTRSRGRPPP